MLREGETWQLSSDREWLPERAESEVAALAARLPGGNCNIARRHYECRANQV